MKEMIEKLKNQQLEDLKLLKNLLIKIFKEYPEFFRFSSMKDFQVFEDVIIKCNEVDYNNMETVMAYVMLHLLERYNRFQYMQLELLENEDSNIITNLTKKKNNNEFDYTIRILDVGTGPAPALLAFSDFYEWLKQYNAIRLEIKSDYVENSDSFRHFLHIFTEIAMKESKRYHIPFHKGNHHDIVEYSETYRFNRRMNSHHKYDLVIFSNFLTTPQFVTRIESNLKKVFNSMTNKSIAIISGGNSENEYYKKTYDLIDGYLKSNVNHKQYRGHWKQIFSSNLKLEKSEYLAGEIVNEYFREVKKLLIEEQVYERLPEVTRKLIEKGSDEKDCSTWHLKAYQKKSYDISLIKNGNKQISKKNEINYSRNKRKIEI